VGPALGQHLLNLDVGLPVDRLRPLVRRALSGDTEADELVLEAVNRRGRSVTVRVARSPPTSAGEQSGTIIAMEAGEFAPGRGGHPADR
jgi:two-component system, chemotaxis family, CheB/CheR fusion protein